MVIWAHVNGLSCMDADIGTHENENEDTYEIYDPSQYGVEVEFYIEEKGKPIDGGDIFQCLILTPERLKNLINTNPSGTYTNFGRGYYIVKELTSETLRDAVEVIRNKMNSTWASDYRELLLKLSWFGIGEWDFVEDKFPYIRPDGTIDTHAEYYMDNHPRFQR